VEGREVEEDQREEGSKFCVEKEVRERLYI
jgi:hypothetical protein